MLVFSTETRTLKILLLSVQLERHHKIRLPFVSPFFLQKHVLLLVGSSVYYPDHKTLLAYKIQPFTYGVVSEGFFAEILRKIHGNLQKMRAIASGKGAEILRKFRGNLWKFAEMTPSRTTP